VVCRERVEEDNSQDAEVLDSVGYVPSKDTLLVEEGMT